MSTVNTGLNWKIANTNFGNKVCHSDEVSPRTIPKPYQSKMPKAAPSVPEASFMFNENNSFGQPEFETYRKSCAISGRTNLQRNGHGLLGSFSGFSGDCSGSLVLETFKENSTAPVVDDFLCDKLSFNNSPVISREDKKQIFENKKLNWEEEKVIDKTESNGSTSAFCGCLHNEYPQHQLKMLSSEFPEISNICSSSKESCGGLAKGETSIEQENIECQNILKNEARQKTKETCTNCHGVNLTLNKLSFKKSLHPSNDEVPGDINKEQVSPKLYSHLLEQNAQLKQLQSQIQRLLVNQKHLKKTSTEPGVCSFDENMTDPTESEQNVSLQTSKGDYCTLSTLERNIQRLTAQNDFVLTAVDSCGKSYGDISTVTSNHSVEENGLQSDLIIDLPSYHSSPLRFNKSESYNPGYLESFITASMSVSHEQMGNSDTDSLGIGQEDYEKLINNVKRLLESRDSYQAATEQKNDSFQSELESTYGCSENEDHYSSSRLPFLVDPNHTTSFSKLDYLPMLLDSDAEASVEINAMALKYLKDEQLTQLAKMQPFTNREDWKASEQTTLRQIMMKEHTNSADISKYGMSSNDMTYNTRKYMEKYKLFERSVSDDHSKEIDRWFSCERCMKKDTDELEDFGSTFFSKLSKQCIKDKNTDLNSTTNNCDRNSLLHFPKQYQIACDSSQSPFLRRQSSENEKSMESIKMKKNPEVHNFPKNVKTEMMVEGTDKILDIAKLKQLPKLL